VDEGRGAGEEGWWAARRRMASIFMAHRLNLCGKDLNLYDNVHPGAARSLEERRPLRTGVEYADAGADEESATAR